MLTRASRLLVCLPLERVLGKTDFELFSQEQAAAFRANDLKVLETGSASAFEEIAIHDDGPHTSVVYKFPLFDADGKIYASGGIVTDITERKRIEEALRESEARFRYMADYVPTIIWINDVLGRCTYVNRQWTEFTGTVFERQLGFGWLASIHPDDQESTKQLIEAAFQKHKPFRIDYRLRRFDGEYRSVIDTASPRFGHSGEFLGYIGAVIDITERKRAEEELKKALAEVQRLKERLELENVYLRSEVSGAHRYGEIIGESEGIRKVLEEVKRVAVTDMTVLILGETGTGKELVARLVYEKSGRRERPLVKVNCSALPAELIESELFGHERGAFTGAVAKQVGRFELADGGTIFLDEVGELPLRLQSKLLTVLQEGEFERLGSGKTIKVDVRVIAATNRNLSEAVQRGRFRSDLYYRLNVYPIEIPPLREHREDIELLAEAFLQEAGRRLGKSFGKISGEVIEALQGYSWPGNVRELENVIGRAAVTSTGLTLQLPDGWKAEGGLINRNTNPNSNVQVRSNPPVTNSDREATHGRTRESPYSRGITSDQLAD